MQIRMSLSVYVSAWPDTVFNEIDVSLEALLVSIPTYEYEPAAAVPLPAGIWMSSGAAAPLVWLKRQKAIA